MSSEVKRYWPEEIVGTGELVVYLQDYAALEAECEKLRKEKSARQALSIQLIDEARALRAELAAIKGQEPAAPEGGEV